MIKNGFTLIELLIVVAVLGILAAIAVPNYRDAMIKSRLAVAKIDLKTLGDALQTYRIDRNIYPRKNSDMKFFADYLLPDLTTPVAYINIVNVKDPFGPVNEYEEPEPERPAFDDSEMLKALPLLKNSYTYTPYMNFADLQGLKNLRKEAFALASMGPDQMDSFIVDFPFPKFNRFPGESVYNPSNGIISPGDLGFFGGDISVSGLIGG